MARKKLTEKQKAMNEYKRLRAHDDQQQRKKQLYEAKEWYTIRALLGNQWANWFIMAGARERPEGKHLVFRTMY